MKRVEFVKIFNDLSSIKDIDGVKFGYALAKNINIMKSEVETMQSSLNPTPKFQEYDRKRVELAEKFSKKNEDGTPEIIDNAYKIQEITKFNTELEKLQGNYKEEIDAQNKKIEEYNSLLDEEIAHEFFKLKLENIPETMAKHIPILYPIIEE